MGPVDTLKIVNRPGATLGRDVELAVNGQSLVKHIVARAPHWSEARQLRVNLDALRESASSAGTYPILVCAHCAEAGYWSPADIGLSAVEVGHQNGTLTWRFTIADAGPHPTPIVFRFHGAQVEATLARFEGGGSGTKDG